MKANSTSTLVMIVGPPAVGKMTVGYELAARTGLKLFHNHQIILDSNGKFDGRADYLRIENTELPPAGVAERIIEHFSLGNLKRSEIFEAPQRRDERRENRSS